MSGDRERLAYDPALDGLRAIAVIAVLLYHGAVEATPGGFLGVDLFFVLSGYLITTLLVLERESTGAVDLGGFWGRRARRLLPALLVVLVWVLVYGTFIAEPTAAAGIRRDVLGTLFYVANWTAIADDVSYLELFSDPSPLLHTWSLAIEEQWYLVWPVVFFVLVRRRRPSDRVWLAGCIAAAAASALWMAVVAGRGDDPSRAYYGTDTHVSGLLIGAALAFALHSWRPALGMRARALGGSAAAALGLVGFTALVATASDDSDWMYRGGFALAALACAALIGGVVLVGQANVLRRGLSLVPLVAIGRISYGLYLWHWPLFVFLTPTRTGVEGWPLLALRLAVTATCATASYWLVEQPAQRATLPRPQVVRGAITGALAISAAAFLVLPTTGAATLGGEQLRITSGASAPSPDRAAGQTSVAPPARGDDPAPSPIAFELGPLPTSTPAPANDPVVAPGEVIRTLVVGDSVYLELAAHFDNERYGARLSLSADVRLGCGIIEGDVAPQCSDRLASWASSVEQDDPHIVLLPLSKWDVFDKEISGATLAFGSVAHRAHVVAELERDVAILGAGGARVVLVDLPCMRPVDDALGAGVDLRTDPQRATQVNDLAREFVAGSTADVRMLELRSFTCPTGEYQGTLNDIELHRDGVHFSGEGRQLVWAWLVPQIELLALA